MHKGPWALQQNRVLIEEVMNTRSKIRVTTGAQPPAAWCSALRWHQTTQLIPNKIERSIRNRSLLGCD